MIMSVPHATGSLQVSKCQRTQATRDRYHPCVSPGCQSYSQKQRGHILCYVPNLSPSCPPQSASLGFISTADTSLSPRKRPVWATGFSKIFNSGYSITLDSHKRGKRKPGARGKKEKMKDRHLLPREWVSEGRKENRKGQTLPSYNGFFPSMSILL